MVELALVVALALLAAGVLGSVLPLVPSGVLSLAGVWTYALVGREPVGWVVLAVLTASGLLAAAFEHLAGPIAAKLGGSSTRVMLAATLVGALSIFVLGPLGIVVGVVATVFGLELWEGTPLELALRRSIYTAIGILGSSLVQLLLTGSILAFFVLFVVVL